MDILMFATFGRGISFPKLLTNIPASGETKRLPAACCACNARVKAAPKLLTSILSCQATTEVRVWNDVVNQCCRLQGLYGLLMGTKMGPLQNRGTALKD